MANGLGVCLEGDKKHSQCGLFFVLDGRKKKQKVGFVRFVCFVCLGLEREFGNVE